MAKIPNGYATSIMYEDRLYDLTTTEYCELEERLTKLDTLSNDPEIQSAGFEWIVYHYLTEQGYELPCPVSAEPKSKASEWDAHVEDRAASEKAKKTLEDRTNPKNHVQDEYAHAKPVREAVDKFYERHGSTNDRKRSSRRDYDRERPIGRDEKADNAGGGLAMVLIFVVGISSVLSFCSNTGTVFNGNIVRPDGTIIGSPYKPRPRKVQEVAPQAATSASPETITVKKLETSKPTNVPKKTTSKTYYNQMNELMGESKQNGGSGVRPPVVEPYRKPLAPKKRGTFLPKETVQELLQQGQIEND